MALTNKLTAIGDAIREKTGSTEKLTLDAMPNAIKGIIGGGDCIHYVEDGECVTFMVENEPYAISIVKGDDSVSEPQRPNVVGILFKNWIDSNGNKVNFPFNPNGNCTLYSNVEYLEPIVGELNARYVKWENVKWHYNKNGSITNVITNQTYPQELYVYTLSGINIAPFGTITSGFENMINGRNDLNYYNGTAIIDLGSVTAIGKIVMNMYPFNTREYFYKISVSEDGTNWNYIWNEDGEAGHMNGGDNQIYISPNYRG